MPAAGCKRKWPRKTGAIGQSIEGAGRVVRSRLFEEILYFQAQRPKRGRSPLRMAIRLLAVSRRSMEAIRRPNRVLEGSRPTDAVLDMFVPFSWCGTIPLRDLASIYVYQIPVTTGLFALQQLVVCIAAKLTKWHSQA